MGNYTRSPYHSQNPAWRNGFRKHGQYIGIEYEMESSTGNYRDLLDLLPDMNGRNRPCTEMDGSLSSSSGIEIVFAPMSYRHLLRKDNTVKNAIRAMAPVAQPHPRTGMHCNINTYGWSVVKRALFTAMIQNMRPVDMERIGGRTATSYCRRVPNKPLNSYTSVMHHSAAENKSDRIEIRFPQATSDPDRLDLIVSFADSLERFCAKHVNDYSQFIREELLEKPTSMSEFQWRFCTSTNTHSKVCYLLLWNEYKNYLRASPRGSMRRKLLEVMESGYEAVDFDSSTEPSERIGEGVAVAAAA
jgi:hypothetical protein